MLSSKEDFPDDCEPTTAIFGSLMNYCKPTSLSSSITLMSFLRFSKSPTPLKSADYVSAIWVLDRLLRITCQLFVFFIFKENFDKGVCQQVSKERTHITKEIELIIFIFPKEIKLSAWGEI